MVDIRVNWRLACVRCRSWPSRSSCRRAIHPEGRHRHWFAAPTSSTSRFALRPILDGEGYRPYYVAGYAGASYGPGLFSPPEHGRVTDGPGPGHTQCDGRAGDVGPGVSASAFPAQTRHPRGEIV